MLTQSNFGLSSQRHRNRPLASRLIMYLLKFYASKKGHSDQSGFSYQTENMFMSAKEIDILIQLLMWYWADVVSLKWTPEEVQFLALLNWLSSLHIIEIWGK